ncbi:MAG: flagellar FliJ family protein [Mobiluncus porci]|uniref:Flagellar export protein FliJ n=1 Tax=Mobiluncus porci TaxID=2652278 RepID=A0A7K0K3E5_9ACTO|nr:MULTISPECIES: flagellar FliJ family protein [Mobiluncus]MCI6584703.1 flagellar FliJ family protein [Mobiluncus sp.]MDD7540990.1 flagellar FliJ family protein [Mobiluncus porci]MDY5748165.1 flagellar FliJ family protein [Mobiluncus porci]MST50001.1 flagellar export protein FliJ [Mobiluncus porci]
MERAFRLQGLLNLRHLQEDQAAGRLATAHADLHDADKRLGEARERLGEMTATSGSNLAVAAAMRNAARMQIQEGLARREYAQAVVDQRQVEWVGAKRLSATLEKLENRHAEAVIADDLHKEQVVLDELASHMGNSGSATDGLKTKTSREDSVGKGGRQ